MAMDAGTWTALESQGYTGPDLSLETGTFTTTQMRSLVTDGTVRALEQDATGGYIVGGNFTKAYFSENDRGGGDVLRISNATRTALAFVDGAINAIVSDGAGGVYIGGDFSYVGGVARQRLAQILSNGTLSSWNPGCNGVVHALRYFASSTQGAVVYVGGRFDVCGGSARYNYAQLSASTGAATSFAVGFSVAGSYAAATVYTITLGINTNGTFNENHRVGGYFDTVVIGGTGFSRGSVVSILGGASPSIFGSSWDVRLTGGALGTVFACYTFWRSQNGDQYEVIAGRFDLFNGSSRSNIAFWRYTTGSALASIAPSANNTVRTIAGPGVGAGHDFYFGGDFTTFGTSNVSRNYVAAFNSNDPASPWDPTAWNPGASAPVRSLALSGGFIYAAGDFTTFGGQAAKRVAKCSTALSTAENWNTTLDVFGKSVKAVTAGTIFGASNVVAGGDNMTTNFVDRGSLLNVTGEGAFGNVNSAVSGTVHALHRHGDTVYVGGQFTAVGGATGNKGLAKLDIVAGTLDSAWRPTSSASSPRFNALAYHNSAVFAGGSEVKKVDATTGVIDAAWTPTVSGTVNAFHLHGGKLVIGDNSLRAVDLTTGAAATWANASAFPVRAMTRVDSTLYAVGTLVERYAFDTGVRDTTWTPAALAGAIQGVAVTDQYIYAGTNGTPWAWRLNLDGSDAGLSLLTGYDVLAVMVVSDNFVLFGGAMTLSSYATRPERSLVYLVET